ncbi:MAG: hypothetical protein QOF84_581 [Streptomyces sp.]|jgi:hypothetical protein|nr:hypothetical protein [Streptomyces sp.]MDX6345791.1 hypothetical protein [Streptomyces sp.]
MTRSDKDDDLAASVAWVHGGLRGDDLGETSNSPEAAR